MPSVLCIVIIHGITSPDTDFKKNEMSKSGKEYNILGSAKQLLILQTVKRRIISLVKLSAEFLQKL